MGKLCTRTASIAGGFCLVLCLLAPAWAQQAGEAAPKKVSFYGFFRLDAIRSDSRLNHNQYSMWAESEDPTKQTRADQGFLDLYPRLTRFGVKVEEEPGEGKKLFGNLELDFQNRATSETAGKESESRQIPRLRHGYLKYTTGGFSLLAGQTSDLIAPLWPSANADAGLWNSGNLGDRRPQIRLTRQFGTVELAVAAGRTGAVDVKDLDGDNRRDGDESGKPMLQARLGAAGLLDKRLDLGLWTHSGSEQLRAKSFGGNTNFHTSGFGVDLKVKLTDQLGLAGEFWSGKNLSDLRGGIGQGVNTTTGKEIEAQGGWAELIYKQSAQLTLAAGTAWDDPDDDDLNAGNRAKNAAVYGSARYEPVKNFAFGLELIQWKTDYVGFAKGDATRINLYFAYSF